jgi:hypothetical protein
MFRANGASDCTSWQVRCRRRPMPDRMIACQIAKQLNNMVFLKSRAKASFKGGGQFRRRSDKLVGLMCDIAPRGIRPFCRPDVSVDTLDIKPQINTEETYSQRRIAAWSSRFNLSRLPSFGAAGTEKGVRRKLNGPSSRWGLRTKG